MDELIDKTSDFRERLVSLKQASCGDVSWYPYDTLANVGHLDRALEGNYRKMLNPERGGRILDVGCADGDLGFLLESMGYQVQFLDYAPTNFNSLSGLRTLHRLLGSQAEIVESDIDTQFQIRGNFELAVCLGLLYHLKNPYYFLEQLAKHARYCVLSTRVFQVAGTSGIDMSDIPVAYLVGSRETNNDPTNFWMFTSAGLRRLFQRTGWNVLSYKAVGATSRSNPSDADRDERAFCLLRSTVSE